MGSGDAKRPFRQRTNASSNSAMFEKRGDPWVSPRQGLEDFGRVLSTENPDMDSFTRAHKAKERHERGPDKPIRAKPAAPDDLRRAANINLVLKRRMKEAAQGYRDPDMAKLSQQMRGKQDGKEPDDG